MPRTAAKTSIMPMVLVAVEQSFPPGQRIVDDRLALRVLPAAAKIFVWFLRLRWPRDWMINATERSNAGIWGGLLCRKRYIDEKLVASGDKIEAVVNLGAGLDTRVYRLPALAGLPIWEIDQRENIEAKVRRLRRALGEIPPNIKLVSIDFD